MAGMARAVWAGPGFSLEFGLSAICHGWTGLAQTTDNSKSTAAD